MKYSIGAAIVLFLLAGRAAQAAEVEVRPTPKAGVSIVSAELVQDLGSSGEVLLVRLRNDSAGAGQSVGVAATVHDADGATAGGFVRGGCMNGVSVDAPRGGEKVVTHEIDMPLDVADTVTVELRGVDGDAGDAEGAVAAEGGYSFQACMPNARSACEFGIQSFEGDEGNQHCSFTCMSCEDAGAC